MTEALMSRQEYLHSSALVSDTNHRGNKALLDLPRRALFCSASCPGDVIIRAHDYFSDSRADGSVTIAGFQSSLERIWLALLLRARQPVVICPARAIETMRVPVGWRAALDGGSLMVVSPFSGGHRRATAESAVVRNEFVAGLADKILVPHAALGSKTEALCIRAAAQGKRLLTFASPNNANLIALGAHAVA